jgi:aminopeptidase N
MKTHTIAAAAALLLALAPAPALAQRARRRNPDPEPAAAPPPAAPAEDPTPRRYPRDRPIRVVSEALDLDVDLEAQAVSGTATIVFETRAEALGGIELDAAELEVDAVREPGPDGRPLSFFATGRKLAITYPEPLAVGASNTVEIAYHLAHPKTGLHFFKPTPDEPDVPYQVWSQGESEEARYWFPCVDAPEERMASELVVHAPAGFQVISNGKLAEPPADEPSGKTRWHWREGFPHPAYLVTLVVGKFARATEDWQGVAVDSYVPPARADDAPRSFENTKAMLEYFSKRFGVKYPYEQYAQVVVEQFIHGGMENMSATTLTERTLHDARAHLDTSSDGLVAHELAHQWWGDMITCRDWAHIWLNEGFASYFEACWDEEKNGADAYDYNMLEKAGGALEGGRNLPLVRRRYREADDTFGGGTYPKGAWVLHMLRRELGEDGFWRGFQAYAKEHAGTAVETEDFRRSLERANARSLGDFFWQWTERAGHPVFDVSVGWDAKDALLEVEVAQKQEGEPFHVAVDLEVATGGGSAPEIKTIPMRIAAKEERLFFPLAARPRWVRFDAREAILKEVTLHEDRDQLLAMLAGSKRAIARIEAARALAKDHTDGVAKALGKALRAEPFWGAAAEYARILGAIPGERARDELLAGLAVTEPRARRVVVSALAAFHGDKKVGDALAALAEKGDPSVHVEAEVASALARIQDPRAFDVLQAMAGKPSSQETLETTALRGLAELLDLRGLPIARERLSRGHKRDVRLAAIDVAGKLAALKECDEATRKAVAAEIVPYLDDSNPWVRGQTIDALRGLGAESTLPALDALAARDPHDNVRERARAAAEKIRAGAPPDAEIARLREEIRKVEEERKGLEERLARVEARGGGGEESKGGGAKAAPAEGPR